MRVAQDGFADLGDVAAGGEVHHGVGAMVHRYVQLAQLLGDLRGDGGVADVGVDLAAGGDADAHRLHFGVVDVGGNDQASGGNLVAHQLGGDLFAFRNKRHLLGDLPQAGKVHLGHVGVAGAQRFLSALDDPLRARLEDLVG